MRGGQGHYIVEKLNHVRCARAFVGLNLVGFYGFLFLFLCFLFILLLGVLLLFFLSFILDFFIGE